MKSKINKKKIIGWIIYIVILIALIVGTPKALSYFLKTDYPMASITSGSMWPALKQGDLVLIKGVYNKDELKVGDIVVYKNPKGFTIHRVERLREKDLITRGDANNVADAPVKYEDVIGKTLTIGKRIIKIPYLGKLGLLFQKINGKKTN